MNAAKRIQLIIWRVIFAYYVFERLVNHFWGDMSLHYCPVPDLFVFYKYMPSDKYGWLLPIITAIIYGIVVFEFLIAFAFKYIIVDLPRVNIKLYQTLFAVFMVICLVDAIGCFLIVPAYCHPLFSGIMDGLLIGLSVWMLNQASTGAAAHSTGTAHSTGDGSLC